MVLNKVASGLSVFIAGRDADIVHAESGLEWMRRFILPAAAPVITKFGDDIHAKIHQLLFVVFLVEEIILDLFGGGDRLDQLDLFGSQAIEDRFHIGSLHAAFVIIQQRIVGMIGRREEGNIFVDQFHHFFEMRLEDRKIRFASRLHPGFERLGGDDGLFGNERRRDAFGFVVIAGSHAHQRGFISVRAVKFLFQILDQPAHFIGDEFFLRDLAQRRKLLAARFVAAGRHVDLLVPAQHAGCTADICNFTKFFF